MSLPLKLKLAVRDHWASEASPPAKDMAALHALLGLPVVCEPEWALLLAELDAAYPDRAQLVAAVAGSVQAWCRAASELFDGEGQWSEEALERIKEAGSRLVIFVEVSKEDYPSTAWSSSRNAFVLSLPKIAVRHALEFISHFKSGLITAFEAPAPEPTSVAADDWTDVVVAPASSAPAAAATASKPAAAKVTYLANAETLPRPDELLLLPPYYLSVYAHVRTQVEVQCSHGPSIELLARYLKKWCRANNNLTDRPALVNVELHQSPFGLGLIHDRLTLEAEHRYGGTNSVSPTLVLSLVEGVLGYERIYNDASCWHFRRTEALKK